MTPDVLLRPNVRCPNCGARPRIRLPQSERARYLEDAPDRVIQTYRCHRDWCRRIYAITVEAFQGAE